MTPTSEPKKRRRKGKKTRPPGQGSIYTRGGSTWIRWRVNGVRRQKRFPGTDERTREVAERALSVALLNIAAGRAGVEIERPRVPLAKLADEWLASRTGTHRSAKEDSWRWHKHLKPTFGHLLPDEVDSGLIKRFIRKKLAEKLSPSTVRLLVRELSSLFSDLVDDGDALRNPVATLPRKTRRLIRPAHDPKKTPYLKTKDDIRRVFLMLPEPINIAFLLGALAGLRSGELLALRWDNIDFEERKINVHEAVIGRRSQSRKNSSVGKPKDDDSRDAPIVDSLLPVLKAWKLKTGGKGVVVQPMRSDGKHCDAHTLRFHLNEALKKLGLLPANDTEQDADEKLRPRLNWYRCTRHTFATHWVKDGRPIEKLKEILGHSSVQMTERYAHNRKDTFGPADLAAVAVDLSTPAGKVVDLDHAVATPTDDTREMSG